MDHPMTAVPVSPALTLATGYRDRGWRPFPLDHPALNSCASPHKARPCDGKRGKHPVGNWGTMSASVPTDQMLELWFGAAPRNVGIACGPSGLLVVDEDIPNALEILADELGEVLPATYRVHTSRGWHYYFGDPESEFGNSAGALAQHGMDVRGGQGAGGYVVAAGSMHQSGAEYIAEDPWADIAPLPEWVKAQIRAGKVHADGTTSGPPADGWTDEPRYGTRTDLLGQYERHLTGVRTRGGDFRHELYLAALDGWRLVNAGVVDEFTMLSDLRNATVRVWGADPDDRDREIVYGEAQRKAKASPWVVIDPGDPRSASTSSGGEVGASEHLDADEIRERRLRAAVADRIWQLDVDELARKQRGERDRAARPSILDGLVDSNDLDDLPDPKMLLGEFIPAAGVGILAGKFGSYKSFVTLSWACSLASGRAWLDKPEFAVPEPVRVLYVAAEGASGMKMRRRAWCSRFGDIPRDQLTFYPRAINLTDPLAIADLEEAVAVRGYGVVIVDTLHRSAPGAEENSSTELGVVFEAACRLRDEYGVTVLFVDHTGHDGAKPRGTSIKVDDTDFVIIADRPGDDTSSTTQRSLRMFKRKDMDTDGEWPIRLTLVPDTESGYVEIGIVGSPDAESPFGVDQDWHSLAHADVPEDVIEKLTKAAGPSKGKGKKAAMDIFRLLRFVGGERGMTRGEIQGALSEGVRVHHRSSVHAALELLSTVGATEPGSTNERFVLARKYAQQATQQSS